MGTFYSKESIEKIKKDLPAILESNPMMGRLEIALKLGFKSRNAVARAVALDPEIKKMIDEYDKEREPNIKDAVSRTWINRLVTGKAQASEYIFFMMNKFPDEYKDMRISKNVNLNGIPDDKDFRDEFFGLVKPKDENHA